MHRRLDELVDYVDAQRTALLHAASAVPDERWSERPAPDRWSVADLFEHLSRVETGCARTIAKRMAEGRAAGVGPEREESSRLRSLEGKAVADRSNHLKASERVTPSGGMDHDRAVEAITASRAELRQAMRDADGLAVGELHQPFPGLGDLDVYQWILFVGQHEARHCKQVDEIASQLGASKD